MKYDHYQFHPNHQHTVFPQDFQQNRRDIEWDYFYHLLTIQLILGRYIFETYEYLLFHHHHQD